jgi:hypothetical protein
MYSQLNLGVLFKILQEGERVSNFHDILSGELHFERRHKKLAL